MLGSIKSVSVWHCAEFQCAIFKRLKSLTLSRECELYDLRRVREKRDNIPPPFFFPCETCCTAESFLICFYISVTVPRLSWPVSMLVNVLSFLSPVNKAFTLLGLESHTRCDSFQTAPYGMDNLVIGWIFNTYF